MFWDTANVSEGECVFVLLRVTGVRVRGMAGRHAGFTTVEQPVRGFHTTCSDSPTCFLFIIFNNKNTTYLGSVDSSLCDIA